MVWRIFTCHGVTRKIRWTLSEILISDHRLDGRGGNVGDYGSCVLYLQGRASGKCQKGTIVRTRMNSQPTFSCNVSAPQGTLLKTRSRRKQREAYPPFLFSTGAPALIRQPGFLRWIQNFSPKMRLPSGEARSCLHRPGGYAPAPDAHPSVSIRGSGGFRFQRSATGTGAVGRSAG